MMNMRLICACTPEGHAMRKSTPCGPGGREAGLQQARAGAGARLYFLPTIWPMRPSHLPFWCLVTPRKTLLVFWKPLDWRRSVCTTSSAVTCRTCSPLLQWSWEDSCRTGPDGAWWRVHVCSKCMPACTFEHCIRAGAKGKLLDWRGRLAGNCAALDERHGGKEQLQQPCTREVHASRG